MNAAYFSLFAVTVLAAAPNAWEAHFSQAEAFSRAGNYLFAVGEFELALHEAELLGTHDAALPVTLTNVAVMNSRLGHFSEAGKLYQRAIGIFESCRPDLRDGLATTLHDYAALKVRERRWSEADLLYQRAYNLRLEALGPDHFLVGVSLSAMGELAAEIRRYDIAEKYYLEALRIYDKASGQASTDMADLEYNLAMLYLETGRSALSGPLFVAAIEVYQRLAPDHPRLTVILRNYAESKWVVDWHDLRRR